MKKSLCSLFPLVLTIQLITSCATVISGTSQAITIDSNVPGSTVTIEGNVVGVTPFTGKIKRQKEAVAMVAMDGYVAQPLTLTTSFNSVAVLSIFWDYSTTDCLTGAVWEYAPTSYYVNLKRVGEKETAFKRESSAKAFAMTYFGDIQVELAAGGGPKLRSLHGTFFADRGLDQFVSEVQSLPQTDAIRFGELMANLMMS